MGVVQVDKVKITPGFRRRVAGWFCVWSRHGVGVVRVRVWLWLARGLVLRGGSNRNQEKENDSNLGKHYTSEWMPSPPPLPPHTLSHHVSV